MEFPSKLIEDAVAEVSKLPGIGRKTALRLVLHLIKQPAQETNLLAGALKKLRDEIRFCNVCHNISDDTECAICRSNRRDKGLICVVEETQDVMAIENTGQYTGVYHVLGGIISPVNGIGPSDLHIESLISRVSQTANPVKEVILALSPTMEGDTTAFYLHRKLREFPVRITSIARGIPMGGELEFADEITLGRSIVARTLFN